MTVGNDDVLDDLLEAMADDDPVQLYENAPCGYLSTDARGTITKVNHTLLTMTGYERADLVGRLSFQDLLTVGGRIYHETHYAPLLLMQGTAREIALDLVTAAGGTLPVLVNAILERDASGQPKAIRTAVFDARQRREYERELLLAKMRAEESEAQARALARTLQQTLMPPHLPTIPGLDLAALYRAAGDGSEVGGDFYDVFQVNPEEWVVTLGDVSGKGVEAAVITAMARYTLRSVSVEQAAPAAALQVLNSVLLGHETDRFCTVLLLRLRRTDGGFVGRLGIGGHPLPLLRSPDGTVTEIGTPGGLVGALDELHVDDTDVTLSSGQALVLFTDGVPEGRRGSEFYGTARLRAVVEEHGASARELADAVLTDVLEFQGGTARDDIALVVLAVPPG